MTDRRQYEKARRIDDDLDEEAAFRVAFRKFVHTLGGTTDDPDVGIVEATYRALDEVDQLRERHDRLADRVAELEQVVDPNPGAVEYEQLTRAQKVHHIRRTLVERAAQTNGLEAMDYRDVQWLFDGNPSAGHCYDLMDLAASLDGFAFDEPGKNRNKRIRVNLSELTDETLIHAANKATGGDAP